MSYGACQTCGKGKSRRKNRDAKRARSFDGDSSKNMIEIQDKSRFKKRISNQVPSNFPKNSGYRMDNPKPKKGKGTSSPTEKPTCGSTMVNVLRRRTIFLVVVKVGKRIRIVPM